ncbi:MAG TPA: phage major capsid protein [Candidatus Acidoferrum sp.]|nr:phage major capsid protein [Candidatus Acidoferrum sp.]
MSTTTRLFKSISPSGMLELRQLDTELQKLMSTPGLTRGEAKRADVIIARMAAIRDAGITDLDYHRAQAEALGLEIHGSELRAREAHEKIFRLYVTGKPQEEIKAAIAENRDFQAGQATPSFTQGTAGGFTVPMSFQKSVAEGLAAVDPLLSPEICNVVQEPDFTLRPLQLPGWDLSTLSAVKVTEAAQQGVSVAPGLTQQLLNKYTYRVSLSASFEWEEDQRAFDSAMAAMGRAFGVGFARGIGADLVLGDGVTAPQGIAAAAADSGVTTANAGKLVLGDFTDVFYSVNKAYRESDKAAWLVNDAVAKMISNCVDDQHRPLFPVVDGVTQILGKPVYVAPSLPAYNASLGTQAAGSFCVFGDLSHYTVHTSTMYIRRRLLLPDAAKALFTGLMMADAAVQDPTDGALPPIVTARLHS